MPKMNKTENLPWYKKYLTLSESKWIKIGTEYGGWYIPENFIKQDSICYCLGVGEDVSFDLGLINKFDCAVISVDPTPRAIKHFQTIIENTKNGISTEIKSGNISEVYYKINKNILDKWFFLPYGVWKENTKQKFYAPKNPEHVSHSIVNLQNTDEYFEAECKTVKTIMQKFKHNKIDLLKMDIEGVEHDVVRSIFQDDIYPEVLLIEYDQPCKIEKIIETTELIIRNGYTFPKLDRWNASFKRK